MNNSAEKSFKPWLNLLRETDILRKILDVLRVSKSTVLNTENVQIAEELLGWKLVFRESLALTQAQGLLLHGIPRLSTSICLGDLNPHFNKVKLLYNK